MTKKKKVVVPPVPLYDDVSPLETMIKPKSMKKSSKYYKKKKRALVEVIKEYNNFFILPAVRLWFDRDFTGNLDKLFFEISWFNLTLAFKIKR